MGRSFPEAAVAGGGTMQRRCPRSGRNMKAPISCTRPFIVQRCREAATRCSLRRHSSSEALYNLESSAGRPCTSVEKPNVWKASWYGTQPTSSSRCT
eukprot:5493896-Prymnesium_polylepis.1